MTLRETQVLVVGAGPSGLIAAREASQRGASVIALEEHSEIGRPCHCAGLLSVDGMRRLKIPLDGFYVQNKVRGAIFFSPSGLSFMVERQRPVAYVVDRVSLDKFLANQAVESGVEIKLGCAASDVRLGLNEILIKSSDGREFRADILIDAEGVSSRILKSAGLKSLNSDRLLSGLQLDLVGVDIDPDFVEIYVGRKIAPGFFAWVIPLGKDAVRVGLGCKRANPKNLLNKFLERRFKEKDYEVLNVRSGVIVTSGPIKKTFSKRMLVVGDAAGQVKPTTGGGVIFGGICAAMAGRVAAEAVSRGIFNEEFLSLYEQLWRKELGKEIRYMLLARRIFNHLSDRLIDRLFEVVISEDLQQFLSRESDMDFQSGIISDLLRRKRIFRLLFPFLRLFRQ